MKKKKEDGNGDLHIMRGLGGREEKIESFVATGGRNDKSAMYLITIMSNNWQHCK